MVKGFFNVHTHTQLEETRQGNKEGSRERYEKVAAAQAKIEVERMYNVTMTLCMLHAACCCGKAAERINARTHTHTHSPWNVS